MPWTAFSALMGAQRVLGLQLCLMVTSYFQRHTPTSQIENRKYDCLDSIVLGTQIRWNRGKKINIGFEIIVFGQILPHKIGVSDLRSPNSQIQFQYTPNTMPIKDGLINTLSNIIERFPLMPAPFYCCTVCYTFCSSKGTYCPSSSTTRGTRTPPEKVRKYSSNLPP